MKNMFAPLHFLNGRFKWAIFIAFILSAAFGYVFYFDKTPNDLREIKLELNEATKQRRAIAGNQKVIINTQQTVLRTWKKIAINLPIDTAVLFQKYESLQRATDSLLFDTLKKEGKQ